MPSCDEGQGAGSNQRGILIAPALVQDLREIDRIEQVSFTAPWSEAMIEAEVSGNSFTNFVVCRRVPGGAILGYLSCWVVFEELRLMNLAVDPPARRHGIATLLVRHALALGQARGATRCVLEVRASNEQALGLYGRFGFRRFGARLRYYSNPEEEAIVMERVLGEADRQDGTDE